jgi:hypothetical protein
MIHLLDPVPFTMENEAHMGLSETQGLLSSDGRNLVIEFRVADTVFGLMKTAPKEILIPLADIQSIRFEKKYLGITASIVLRVRNMQVLQALPDAKLGKVTLKVSRRERPAAEEFCLAVHEVIVRLRGARLENEIEGMLGTNEG